MLASIPYSHISKNSVTKHIFQKVIILIIFLFWCLCLAYGPSVWVWSICELVEVKLFPWKYTRSTAQISAIHPFSMMAYAVLNTVVMEPVPGTNQHKAGATANKAGHHRAYAHAFIDSWKIPPRMHTHTCAQWLGFWIFVGTINSSLCQKF